MIVLFLSVCQLFQRSAVGQTRNVSVQTGLWRTEAAVATCADAQQWSCAVHAPPAPAHHQRRGGGAEG